MFRILNMLGRIVIIDRKRQKILYLQDGLFDDITEKAKKKYEKDKKNKEAENKYVLTHYYEIMRYDFESMEGDTILLTEHQKEFDKKIFEIQKEQLVKKIKLVNYGMKKLEKDAQYHTYELSNI